MTTPQGPIKEDDKLKKHLENGGKVTLESRQTFQSPPTTVELQPVTLNFPGSDDLAAKLSGMETGIKVRANLSFTHQETPNFAVLVYLNAPQANATTSNTDPGYLGPVAFFAHKDQTHHEVTVARLSAGVGARKSRRKEAVTLTLVPVSLAGRPIKAQSMRVSATLELLLSKVEKMK